MAEESTTNEDLKLRLGDIAGGVEKRETRNSLKMGVAGICIAGLVGGGVYLGSLINGDGNSSAPVRETSSTSAFPDDTAAFGTLQTPVAVKPEVVTEVVKDPGQEQALKDMEGRLAALTEQLASMSADNATSSQVALDALRETMQTELLTLQGQLSDNKAAAESLTAKLTQELEAERKKTQAAQEAWEIEKRGLEQRLLSAELTPVDTGPTPEELAEQKRRAMLEERMRQQEALLVARVNSGMLAYSAGGAAKTEASSRELSERESFVANSAKKVAVSVSSKITKPEITVVQGTIIQAALETGIDSSLPGTLRAVVSEDVHSFDGRNVLIPRGSKLFGEYQSDLTIADSRILVAWNRVVTPEGRTAVISSYGADDLGRSGTTGKVNRHFMKRFGAAAMISIIGAAPTLASDRVNNAAAQDALENVGSDLTNQTASVIGEYLSIPPTIRVDQGARITVILDRDLAMP